MGGSTKKIDTTPTSTQQLRGPVVDYLNSQGASNIKAQPVGVPQAVGVQQAGPVGTTFNTGTPIDASMIPNVAGPTGSSMVNANSPVRSVSGPNVNISQAPNVVAPTTQSVDQLGGANSQFFQNMIAQLQPAFDQQRAQAVAAGKEAAGNLTGSGYANSVGNSLNQTLGQQQATLANYAAQGVNTAVQQQSADASRSLAASQSNQNAGIQFIQQLLQGAGLNQQAQQSNQQADLAQGQQSIQAQQANQNAGLTTSAQNITSQQANQQAALQFINQLLTQNSQGLQAQGMGLQAQTQNQNNQQAVYNQDAANQQQSNLLGYSTQNNMAQQNAANFLQLLMGQSLAGVSPQTIQQSGGVGAILQPITQVASAAAGAGKLFGI